jgi:rhodanese-related sulfurtransferase
MKFALVALIALAVGSVLFVRTARGASAETISPDEALKRLKSGQAVLIDVREPAEWQEGVAEPALLLPLSDLRAERKTWAPILSANKDKELVLYCRSGNRSGQAAALLAKEGFKVSNAGAFSAWKDAGLPVRKP